jgi:spore germination protein YaaH
MLVRALGYGTIAGLAQDLSSPFKDVTTNAGYITMAYDLGFVSGISADAFAPDRAATREQVAVILARLYNKLQGASPETVGVVSQPEDVAGLDVVAIPAGQLISSGKPNVNATMKEEAVSALMSAARENGAQTLLYITGTTSALNRSADDVTAVLSEAVSNGGYDGLCLDIPNVLISSKVALTKLAQTLRTALGTKTLYLVVEAPAWDGKTYTGYDYAALASSVDRLVLRVTSYEKTADGFVTAPMEPLEEVYYALAKMKSYVNAGKLSLMLTTTPSAWSGGRSRAMSTQELREVLASVGTSLHYSSRYACAYLSGTDADGKDLTVWYLDHQAVEARIQMAKAFSVGQIFLTDASAAPDLLAGLQ